MTQTHEIAAIGNHTYQHQIAVNLVQSLGMDDAIDFCIQNDWNETLSVILKDQRHFDEPDGATLN